MTLLDTSVLVEAVEGGNPPILQQIRILVAMRERIAIPALVLYEFLRGPRRPDEIAIQRGLFPIEATIPFGTEEAELSAGFYRSLPRARSREFDFAIAATAIVHGVELWTLNRRDFADIPGLKLFDSPSGA